MTRTKTPYNEQMLTAPMKRLTRPDELLQQLHNQLRDANSETQRNTIERRIQVTEKACTAAITPIELTARDIGVLRFLASVRFASTDQIIRFAEGSPKNLTDRLNKLFVRRYVNRPGVQRILLQSFVDLGNSNLVYALGPEGRRLLAQLGDAPKRHSRGKNPLIPHTLATTEFVLEVVRACRTQQGISSIHHHDLVALMPEKTRALDDPFRLRATVQAAGKPISCNVVPDWLMSLVFDDNTRLNFGVEVDRGFTTLAVRQRGKIILNGKRTYARKLTAYYQAFKDDRFLAQWGFARMRILSVVPSIERIENILAAQREIVGGVPGMFLYATPKQIADSGLFAPIWRSSARDGISIIDRK